MSKEEIFMDLAGKKIVVLGDSITAGAAASSESNVYHQRLKEMLNLGELVAYGIGGTRIARQKTPSKEPLFDQDFNMRADTMDIDADLAVVFGGTNDFGHGLAPMGAFGDDTVYTFYGACKCLFEKLIKTYNGNVVVVTPMHRFGEDNPFGEDSYKPTAGPLLKDYVHVILETAKSLNLHVCNLWDDYDLNPNLGDNAKYFISDGLHPNDEGHKLIAQKLANYLKSL